MSLYPSTVTLNNLPHSVHGEVPDLIDLMGRNPLCCQCQKECFNAADKFSAGFKIGLDMLWTGASGLPNPVEFILDGYLQLLPLAPFGDDEMPLVRPRALNPVAVTRETPTQGRHRKSVLHCLGSAEWSFPTVRFGYYYLGRRHSERKTPFRVSLRRCFSYPVSRL